MEFVPGPSLRPLINLRSNSGAYGTSELLDFITTQYPSIWMYPPSILANLSSALPPFTTKKRALEIFRSHLLETPYSIPTSSHGGFGYAGNGGNEIEAIE